MQMGGDQAELLVAAARDLADCLRDGGILLAAGEGPFASDALHVSVEFLHPVVVGRPALAARPATDSAAAALAWLDQRGGALLGIGDGDGTEALLTAGRDHGLLTIALGAGSDIAADHELALPGRDAWERKEHAVTAYHLLWELTHMFIEAGGGDDDLGATAELYPFLAGQATADPSAEIERSAREKLDEVVALRAERLETEADALSACAGAIAARASGGGAVWICGNGGSSTDAAALTAALGAGTSPVPAFDLTEDRAAVTALANDVGVDVVFGRQLAALGAPGDVVVGLSTSGGSANVVRALEVGKERGMLTVGFAGYDGGRMAGSGLVDHLFVVPSSSVHRIQEVQASLYLRLAALTTSALRAWPDRERPPQPPVPG